MLSTPLNETGLPILEQITRTPQFDAQGKLIDRPGYAQSARVLYRPSSNFKLPPVNPKLAKGQVTKAIDLIDSWLEGFPFVSDSNEAEKVNFLSLPLERFARGLISGPLPIHLIEKPTPGTGGTLLVELASIVLTGGIFPAATVPETETNWQSKLLSMLMAGPAMAIFDNVKSLTSPTLASVTTLETYQDKILHTNKMGVVPVRCSWIVTGNNVALSGEIRRRIARSRMDAKSPTPHIGRTFQHEEPRWTIENRGKLAWAFLTLIQAWIAEGKPLANSKEDPYLGKYPAWSAVVGGIFKVCGIKGFLGNLKEFYGEAQTEDDEIVPFIAAWWAAEKGKSVTAAELYESVYRAGDAVLDLGMGDEQGRKVRLGKLLADLKDRQYEIGDHPFIVTVVLDGVLHNAKRYRLNEITTEQGATGQNATSPFPQVPVSGGLQ